jgi:PHD/YefM family antitoxin component YafN of YafNO toxin-antitoxin module
MTEPERVKEIAVEYQVTAADLQEPVVLRHDGREVAVILSMEEYRRLRALEISATERKQAAWEELSTLLADVHSRPTDLSAEEIEAEITKARQEVRELRRAHRSDS